MEKTAAIWAQMAAASTRAEEAPSLPVIAGATLFVSTVEWTALVNKLGVLVIAEADGFRLEIFFLIILIFKNYKFK